MDISLALVKKSLLASRRCGCPVFPSSDLELLAYGVAAVGLVVVGVLFIKEIS